MGPSFKWIEILLSLFPGNESFVDKLGLASEDVTVAFVDDIAVNSTTAALFGIFFGQTFFFSIASDDFMTLGQSIRLSILTTGRDFSAAARAAFNAVLDALAASIILDGLFDFDVVSASRVNFFVDGLRAEIVIFGVVFWRRRSGRLLKRDKVGSGFGEKRIVFISTRVRRQG